LVAKPQWVSLLVALLRCQSCTELSNK